MRKLKDLFLITLPSIGLSDENMSLKSLMERNIALEEFLKNGSPINLVDSNAYFTERNSLVSIPNSVDSGIGLLNTDKKAD